ncbi:Gfo/Idh/MocA family protein [Pelomicrobium methylotrophicum]|uniref:Gfo/Idh/MocA family oxidoreductase n=1 Tax=Pelomicrobium methylotrophicum TaxID=2602750 RepID=A0A5C7EEV9_9PROT|nr:Gfo/Idh/MocA family oxidoreductase [Pelomicrobium methylotrophicum]TXF10389.1 Gfo/Idh/MocA family oxidoreductase [Pelomicrobium methylotrophicum]
MKDEGETLRAAVIGVGYLGRLHAQKYAALANVNLVAVADADPMRAQQVAAELGTRPVTDFRQLLGAIDLASIVVPTERHFEVAWACLEAGVHVLVEKPVTETLEQAQALVALADRHRLTLQVGHLERFNPAFLAAREMIREPMFIESHRLAPFKPRGTDVAVTLDLMIHDIDLILDLVASPVVEVRASGTPVLTDEIDIGNARIEFENGCVANVTASRVSDKAMRKLRVFQPDAYITVDTLEHRLTLVRRHEGIAAAGAGRPMGKEERRFEKPDPLAAEIRDFVACVREGRRPAVSGAEGKRALEVALAITRAMGQRRHVEPRRRIEP